MEQSTRTFVQAGLESAPLPLSGMDTIVDTWTDYVFAYDYQVDAQRLQQSLQQALRHNPYFAGRKTLSDNDKIQVSTDRGLLFEHEIVAEKTPEFDYNQSYSTARYLCSSDFRRKHKVSHTSMKNALLQVKVTQFKDGFVLGLSVWHALADGATFFNFIINWCRYYNGQPVEAQNAVETLDLADWTVTNKHSDKLVDVSHLESAALADIQLGEKSYFVSNDFVNQLFQQHADGSAFAVDVLVAAIWKMAVNAQNPALKGEIRLYSIYDARQLLGLSQLAVGNLLCYPSICYQGAEFDLTGLGEIAAAVRESAFDMLESSDDIRDEYAWLNQTVNRENKQRLALTPVYKSIYERALLFNNLTSVPFQQMGFGGEGPHFVGCPAEEGCRFLTLYPDFRGRDGIVVKLCLPQSELNRFDELCQEFLQGRLG